MNSFSPPGWHLLPLDYQPDDVGSWLLHHEGESLLLELPWGLTKEHVSQAVEEMNSRLRFYTASHTHPDHLWEESFNMVKRTFRRAIFIPLEPFKCHVHCVTLGGEPVYFVDGPKHSDCDRMTIFRGVAMTGDVELGTLDTCNGEIDMEWRKQSMALFAAFEKTFDYKVHTIFSAHMNDCRYGVEFSQLFAL